MGGSGDTDENGVFAWNLEDDTVTVRHRDTQKQDRISTDRLFDLMNESL